MQPSLSGLVASLVQAQHDPATLVVVREWVESHQVGGSRPAALAFAMNVADELVRTGRCEAAVNLLEAMVPVGTVGERLHILTEIGRIQEEKIGDAIGAVAAYERVLQIVPTQEAAIHFFRRYYRAAEDYAGLLRVLVAARDATTVAGHRVLLLREIAELAEHHLDDCRMAIDAYQDICAHVPADESAMQHLARLYEQTGDWERLVVLLERAVEAGQGDRGSRSELLFSLAKVHEERLDRPTDAVRAYEKALSVDPGRSDAREALVRLQAMIERSGSQPVGGAQAAPLAEMEPDLATHAEPPVPAQVAAEAETRRVSRSTQASLWRTGLGQPASALAPEATSLLVVHVGPSAAGAPGAPLDESSIDFSTGAVTLGVQVELAGARVEVPRIPVPGQAKDLPPSRVHELLGVLPRPAADPAVANPAAFIGTATDEVRLAVVGNSQLALFAVRPFSGVTQVRGRVSIIHRNRILQISEIEAPVAATAVAGGPMVLRTTTIHPDLDRLDDRQNWDRCLIAADDLGGRLALTIPGRPEPVELDSLKEPIDDLRTALGLASEKGDPFEPLDRQVDLLGPLIGVAANGSQLYQHLHERIGNELDSWWRIQLVTRGTAFLPLESLYDGPPPVLGKAKMCEEAARALRGEACVPAAAPGEAAPAPCSHHGDTTCICPLRFWGLSKVIERHGSREKNAATDSSTAPRPSRRPFGRVQAVAYGVTSQALNSFTHPTEKEEALRELGQALQRFGKPLRHAQSWNEWRTAVGNVPPPNVLVLIVHTGKHNNISALEIGTSEFLGKHEILHDIVGAEDAVQLLLLLGCSAADAHSDFAPYPERFRGAGADIVLAPLAPIRGKHALKIAKVFAELAGPRLAGTDETPFGELVRDVRRALVACGYCEAMGLVGFGDGDWRIGGRDV